MDPKDRDQLKENDLEHFLFHFNEWWGKWGTQMLVAVLIVLAVFVGKRFWDYSRFQAHEDAWSDLALTSSPDSFRQVALSYDDPAVRAYAYLRGGDALLQQVMAPDDGDEQALAETDSRDRALEEARLMYQQVLDIPRVHAAFVHNARLGLASVAEAQQRWDEAASIYESLVQQAGAYPSIAQQAQQRLEMLDRLRVAVVFAPDEPAPADAGQAQPPAGGPGAIGDQPASDAMPDNVLPENVGGIDLGDLAPEGDTDEPAGTSFD